MILHTLFLSLLLVLPLRENSSSINGSVVDSRKQPINDALIILTPGSHPRITTNKDGAFSLDSLEPGEYTVTILGNGFAPWVLTYVRVDSGQKATLDVTLMPVIEDEFKIKYMEPRQEDLDKFKAALQSFGEPSLCDKTLLRDKYEGYRFLWLRTFHHPILIKLEKNLGKVTLIYKELDGNDYKYGSIAESKSIDIYKQLGKGMQPDVLVQRALDFLFEEAKAEIWEQPYEYEVTRRNGAERFALLDGASWTVEAIKDGKCHVVTRRSPKRDEPVRRFGETLINLSDKRFYYDEFY